MVVRSVRASLISLLGALAVVACGDDEPSGPPRVPTRLTAQSSPTVAATVATVVNPGPAVIVHDQDDKPLRGVAVRFAATGGGAIQGTSVRTNSRGVASAGRWTLGTGSGKQKVVATVASLPPVEFVATVAPSTPVSLSVHLGGEQTGTVATAVATTPSAIVRDQYGNPVPGVRVNFSVRTGGGTATGTAATTGNDGVATLGSWTLGTRSGPQTVGAEVTGMPMVLYTAASVAGTAHAMRLLSGIDQITQVGTVLPAPVVLRATDRYDNVVVNRGMSFSVAQGDGSLLANTRSTDDQGVARIDNWRMGSAPGLNSLTVQLEDLPPLTVLAKAVPVSSYDIQIRFLSHVSGSQRIAFEKAVARWRKAIIGDVPDLLVNLEASACGVGEPVLNEVIDDVLIYAQIITIDGPGDVLGSAGPCVIRSPSGYSLIGVMRFDIDDVADMENKGEFEGVILHEMGHVLGVGTLWSRKQLLAGANTNDPYFTGAFGRAAFASVGGAAYTGTPVPVENVGGPGSRNGHWRDALLGTELMTSFTDAPGSRMPLSLVTIASLADLGYEVTMWGDDRYQYGLDLVAGLARSGANVIVGRELVEAPLPKPMIALDETSRVVPLSAVEVTSRGSTHVLSRRTIPEQQLEVRRR